MEREIVVEDVQPVQDVIKSSIDKNIFKGI